MNYLNALNIPQKQAVAHEKGPLLIIAGAGAGKTRTIAYRIFHLIKSGINPHNILAVTFTNKAAEEMRGRIKKLMENDTPSNLPITMLAESKSRWVGNLYPFTGTFHSLGVHILRENGMQIGIGKNFIIKDKNDSRALIKEAMKEEGVDVTQWDPKLFQNIISRNKGGLVTSESYAGESYTGEGAGEYFHSLLVAVWFQYEDKLKKERALDFDDLILKPVLLLSTKKDVRDYYQNKWHYVHIDEYQDTNHAQYKLSKLLAGERKNICVVGDGDQMVYGWRGANMKNILRFEKDYAGARTIFLEENYRSTKTILDAANTIIEKNQFRVPKKLFTQKSAGEKLSLFLAIDSVGEASFVADTSRTLIGSGVPSEKIAVLYRANFQSRLIEEALLERNISYQVLGTRFFERKEVKDMISFIHAALVPENTGGVKRIINIPPRGIGKVTLLKLFAGQKKMLPAQMREKIKKFYLLLEKIRSASYEKNPGELVKFILRESGMEKHLQQGDGDNKERLLNIKELVTLASRYTKTMPEAKPREQLEKFLEDAVLAADQDVLIDKRRGVRLMTVHASKGLEFSHVFITGLEQGLFPHKRAKDLSDRKTDESMEEERRLFYVALTRARKKIYLSSAEMRIIFGLLETNTPSEFLNDIPKELIDIERQTEKHSNSIDIDL